MSYFSGEDMDGCMNDQSTRSVLSLNCPSSLAKQKSLQLATASFMDIWPQLPHYPQQVHLEKLPVFQTSSAIDQNFVHFFALQFRMPSMLRLHYWSPKTKKMIFVPFLFSPSLFLWMNRCLTCTLTRFMWGTQSSSWNSGFLLSLSSPRPDFVVVALTSCGI